MNSLGAVASGSRGRVALRRLVSLSPLLLVSLSAFAAGCQQKMAEQPYYRPYDPSEFFTDGRSARPLERGVVHRAQRLDSDPLVTGLTADEWARFWKWEGRDNKAPAPIDPAAKDAPAKIEAQARELAFGAPRYDQRKPGEPKVYAEEFPFEITEADLRRGQDRFSVFCAVCHGPLGNGKGKIWERGYLKPTSYHTTKVEPNEPAEEREGRWYDVGAGEIPLGYSRGYWRWGIEIPVREVPPGYIFEVITKGYGAMPDHASQIKPEDRWRIAAYVRVLMFSRAPDQFKGGEGGKK
ncbi:MAG TPA: cytochrome c [Gemmataceae bacterium]|nr:cytochrome c [Gemmataceae bacterium]